MEDFENFEAQAAMEMKQQSLDVMDITGGGSLSRTSSMRSNVGGIGSSSAEAKSPVYVLKTKQKNKTFLIIIMYTKIQKNFFFCQQSEPRGHS